MRGRQTWCRHGGPSLHSVKHHAWRDGTDQVPSILRSVAQGHAALATPTWLSWKCRNTSESACHRTNMRWFISLFETLKRALRSGQHHGIHPTSFYPPLSASRSHLVELAPERVCNEDVVFRDDQVVDEAVFGDQKELLQKGHVTVIDPKSACRNATTAGCILG